MLERSGGSQFGVGDEDWHVVTKGRANVLLVGPETFTSQILDAMRPTLSQPISQWPRGAALPQSCQTLLIQNADQLTLDDQERLNGWLADGPPPQVVTTAVAPLFPLVEQGKFLASLYYHLNVVYLSFESTAL